MAEAVDSPPPPPPPPAGAPPPPALPHTWRPRRARLVAYPVAGVVLAVLTVVALALPDEGPGAFGPVDRVAMVGMGAVVAGFLHVLARVRLVADPDGLTVVNLLRSRRLSWAEVVGVNLRRDDPWVLLDLDDGEVLAVMGIQAADGARARAAAAELRVVLAERTRTERDD